MNGLLWCMIESDPEKTFKGELYFNFTKKHRHSFCLVITDMKNGIISFCFNIYIHN
jgi:hypothetical protein